MPKTRHHPPAKVSTQPGEHLLTCSDVAQILRCSPRQVRDRLAHRPDFPAPIRTPRMLWPRREIDAWLTRQRSETR